MQPVLGELKLGVLTRCQLHGDKLALVGNAPASILVLQSRTNANSFWRSPRNRVRGKSEFDDRCALVSGGISFSPLVVGNRLLLASLE